MARPKRSPIHNIFEWDNVKAGDQYRLQQARFILRSIRVTIQVAEKREDVRAFHPVILPGESSRYAAIEDIVQRRDYLELVVERCRQEAWAWYNRYKRYEELKEMVELAPFFAPFEAPGARM